MIFPRKPTLRHVVRIRGLINDLLISCWAASCRHLHGGSSGRAADETCEFTSAAGWFSLLGAGWQQLRLSDTHSHQHGTNAGILRSRRSAFSCFSSLQGRKSWTLFSRSLRSLCATDGFCRVSLCFPVWKLSSWFGCSRQRSHNRTRKM